MYASNEDEFNREHDDWVFLRQTLPTTPLLHSAMNLVGDEQTTSDSSSSSSPSSSNNSSSSSKSERSESLSSICSTEHESDIKEESVLLNEEPVLTSQTNDLLIKDEVKEQDLSSEIPIEQVNEGETSPVINEYELPNNTCDSNHEIVISTSHFRQRTGANVQQTGDQHPLAVEQEHRSLRTLSQRPRRKNTLIVYGILILMIALPIVLCRFTTSQRSLLDKIKKNLQQTNQRLDQIKSVSIEDIEQNLTKQLEKKFQEILKQKMLEYDQEKYSLVLQINELYYIIHTTQQNFTRTVHQLSNENERLQKQVTGLEERQQMIEKQRIQMSETCSKGNDQTKSATSSPIEDLVDNVIKQTASITTNTSVNLAGIFEQLSITLTDFVDNRHGYVEETKRKLSDFAGSETAEKVQKTIRRSVENLSSYATWIRSRAQQRKQARMDKSEYEEKDQSVRHPWRWTFQRSHDRAKMRHQIPITRKHISNKEPVCHSNYEFPINQLCTMKNWMNKFLQP
ncbi:hypothetical protein I4U23_006827 [Adineta vaga]|nr:hypothetical protein I4U23_006827 [Adineta vaga]